MATALGLSAVGPENRSGPLAFRLSPAGIPDAQPGLDIADRRHQREPGSRAQRDLSADQRRGGVRAAPVA